MFQKVVSSAEIKRIEAAYTDDFVMSSSTCEKEEYYIWENYAVILSIVGNVAWASIIKIDKGNKSILTPLKELLDRTRQRYYVGFAWVKGKETENLIQRLAYRSEVVKQWCDHKANYILIRRG